MPLIIEGGRVPDRWVEAKGASVISIDRRERSEGLSLALINNMPDAALEDTELQFFELLDAASDDLPIYIRLYSLTGVPRTDRGARRLNSFYYPFDDLWQHRFDGVIITGTEPHHPDLRDEPYWPLLTQVFEWAERTTRSTILSCLAAHASVLHFDGIRRHPLPDKKFGVFEAVRNHNHELMAGIGDAVRFPHSRWNEVREDELMAAGYEVLTKSADAGVDLFVKKTRGSLLVHFQGHPEYSAPALAREFRRDVRRFLCQERETYPTLPHGYFDQTATRLLNDFRERALANRNEELMTSFPESVVESQPSSWRASAMSVYRNWVQYLQQQAAHVAFMPMSTAMNTVDRPQRKQSAMQ
jgi:homoserine O-succinyltransferase